jgi:hypothetical protein
MNKYFLTVDWCNKGRRGIFCSPTGNSFWKEEHHGPHTADEMFEILGMFELVLSPESILISEEELKEYNQYYPLAEYSDMYGYAAKKIEVKDENS